VRRRHRRGHRSRRLPRRRPVPLLRLRKTDYAPADLSRWAKRIAAALRGGRDVYCYLKHEDAGKGPVFAAKLEALVGDQR